MNMRTDIDRWLAESALSTNTIDRYRRPLYLIAEFKGDLQNLTGVEFLDWLNSRGWGSSARWLAFCAVRGFLRWKFGDHQALALKIRRSPSPPQRALRLPQIKQLLASFDTSNTKGRRDLAICGTILDTGLRASEICRLTLPYLDLERMMLQVVVKGGHWRSAIYSKHTQLWLDAWLSDRSKVADQGVDNVFVSIGGKTPGMPLTRRGLNILIRRWGERIRIALSPHDLRRSMATVCTTLGAPEDVAMKAGGWKSHDVFRRYTVGVLPSDIAPYLPTSAAMDDP